METLLALLVVGLAAGPSDLNAKVLAFARSMAGRMVGDGSCSALASEALRHAGASRPGRGWGEEVAALEDVRPGDVLELRDTVFVRTRARPDGAVETLTYRSAHHVAIVSAVRRRGRRTVLVVLQQNVGFERAPESETRVVRDGIIDTAEMRRGVLKAYRPAAAPTGSGPP